MLYIKFKKSNYKGWFGSVWLRVPIELRDYLQTFLTQFGPLVWPLNYKGWLVRVGKCTILLCIKGLTGTVWVRKSSK